MKSNEPTETPQRKSTDLLAFQTGLSACLDPMNFDRTKGGTAYTTLTSSWLHTKCSHCKHTFRLDDKVHIEKDGQVFHDSRELPCLKGGAEVQPKIGQEASQFFHGMQLTYPPPSGLNVWLLDHHTEEVKYLLAPAENGFERRTCQICTHTLRPGDIVVLCPCSPLEPRCGVAIHWDPFRGRDCWGAWNANRDSMYCPVTSAIIG